MNWPSMTRRFFLFLTGGLFAKFSLGRASAIKADDQCLSADEILERMAKVYANCESYQDSGCVTTVFVHADGQRTDQRPFSTAFVRSGRFRFEFQSYFHGHRWDRYIVWANGADVRRWWDIQPGVSQEQSLSLALAAATGVSGSSAHTVPALLMPDSIGGRRLTDLTQLELLGEAMLGEVECLRIQGKLLMNIDPAERERRRQQIMKVTGKDMGTPERGPETLWIDKATFLLRRIDVQTQFESFRTDSVTIYEPLLDVAIAENQLRFGPPEE
jgi:hypothetical protein